MGLMFVVFSSLGVMCSSSATNRLIPANDHSSVQINIGRVDSEGRYTGEFDTMALCGFIRGKGLADDALYRLVKENDYLADLRQ